MKQLLGNSQGNTHRGFSARFGIISILVVLVLFASLFTACTSSTTSTSTASTTSTSTASTTSTSTASTTSTSTASTQVTGPLEILNIGFEANLTSDVNVDGLHALQVMADQDNKSGLLIEGKKYQIKLIGYDSKGTQEGEVSAINRLVFEDHVKFIIGDGVAANSWLPITEENKVIVFTQSGVPASTNLIPSLKYSYNATFSNSMVTCLAVWYAKTYPEAAKNMVIAFPDNQLGHMLDQVESGSWKSVGVTPKAIFYPANATDLSAVGTQVMELNPSTFHAVTGSAVTDGLIYNAVYNAGYRGQLFTTTASSANELANTIQPEALKLYMCGAFPTEFDPPLTDTAKSFKAAWMSKYNSWGPPNIANSSSYNALITAIKTANSLDTEKVTSVLDNGLQFDSLLGSAQMISRPDLGTSRTADSIANFYVKQIENNQPKLIGTISIEDGIKYFTEANPPLQPGQTPPGPPNP